MAEALQAPVGPRIIVDLEAANDEQRQIISEIENLAKQNPALLTTGLIAAMNRYSDDQEAGVTALVAQKVVNGYSNGGEIVDIWERALIGQIDHVSEFDEETENEIFNNSTFSHLMNLRKKGGETAEQAVKTIRLLRFGIFIGRVASQNGKTADDPAA